MPFRPNRPFCIARLMRTGGSDGRCISSAMVRRALRVTQNQLAQSYWASNQFPQLRKSRLTLSLYLKRSLRKNSKRCGLTPIWLIRDCDWPVRRRRPLVGIELLADVAIHFRPAITHRFHCASPAPSSRSVLCRPRPPRNRPDPLGACRRSRPTARRCGGSRAGRLRG
jgi:hypothetical protein